MSRLIALASSLLAVASAQQVGTNKAEVHPSLTTQTCTKAGGCTTNNSKIVIDANWRWVHTTTGYTNCYSGNTWDSSICDSDTSCATACALDGADYTGTYGITTSGSALTLSFVTGTNVGSRVYLMQDDKTYQEFNLLNKEFTMDVDTAELPCGLNGAVYFVEMDADGGMAKYPTNKAGAEYGTGYCDSQCPRDLKFINGMANIDGWTPDSNSPNSGTGNMGSCCNEMDIWEANSISAAVTPHPCSPVGQTMCTGADCGIGADRYSGLCDADGCDFNSYRMGNTTFYGPGMTLDTAKAMTVVTQFITDDGTDTGNLAAIKRFYVQNGNVFQNSMSDIPGVTGNEITDDFCAAQKTAFGDENRFAALGGLKVMGEALMKSVLVLSIWDDIAVNMLWLDSTYPTTKNATSPGATRGTCSTSSGVPATIESQSGSATVTYSNIKWGEIGSTFAST